MISDTVLPKPDLVTSLAAMYYGGGKYLAQMLMEDNYARAIQNSATATNFKAKQKWAREAMKLMVDKYALQIMLCCQ